MMVSLLRLLSAEIGTLIVSAVLVRASVSKLLNVTKFAWAVDSYRLFPARGSSLIAVTLPWCEFVVGVSMVAGAFGRYAPASAAALFAVISLGVALVLVRRIQADCGCGARPLILGWRHLVRIGILLGISAALVPFRASLSVDEGGARALGALALAVCVAVVACIDVLLDGRGESIRLPVARSIKRYLPQNEKRYPLSIDVVQEVDR